MKLWTKYQVPVNYWLQLPWVQKLVKFLNKDIDHSNYITTQICNKLTAENFQPKLKQADLVNLTDFDNELNKYEHAILSLISAYYSWW